MKFIKERPILFIIFLVLIATVGFFGKDTYRKYEKEVNELKEKNSILIEKLEIVKIENIKIKSKLELSEKNNLEIIEKINKDGSRIKTIRKSNNKNVTKNNIIDSNTTESFSNNKLKKDTNISKKQIKEKEDVKKISAKKLRIGLGINNELNYTVQGSYNILGPFGLWGNISEDNQSIGVFLEF